MAAFASVVEKRITKSTEGVASKMLDKLKNGDKTNNISKISFPTNLENQAQATYMVIYVFDNERNQQEFASGIFNANVDEDSYEVGAITWVKDQISTAENYVKKNIQAAKDSIVKSGEDWLNRQKAALADSTKSIDFTTVNKIKDFANDYLIPKRKKSESKKLKDDLDPVKHPEAGYKLVKAIQIQMPTSSLTYKYENGWESKDTESLNTIRKLINGVGDLVGGYFGDDKDRMKGGKANLSGVWGKVKNAVGDAFTGGGFSADAQASGNFVYNPAIVFNYTIPTPRTFNYSFTLYPRNKEELYDLFNMIQMLKFYALPQISVTEKHNGGSSQAMTYSYPAKFAIKFYTNGYENKWFPKTLSLGLTSIEETLTGDSGDMAFFENYFDKFSGNPPRVVNLTLSFKELGIMSREAANEGY